MTAESDMQRPEGRLIEHALKTHVPRMSARRAAKLAGVSESRWRQIVSGYQSAGRGMRIPVVAPPEALAAMSRVVGITAEDMDDAGRADVAALLRNAQLDLSELPAEDRFEMMRQEVRGLRYATAKEKRLLLAIIDAQYDEIVTRSGEDSRNVGDRTLQGRL